MGLRVGVRAFGSLGVWAFVISVPSEPTAGLYGFPQSIQCPHTQTQKRPDAKTLQRTDVTEKLERGGHLLESLQFELRT